MKFEELMEEKGTYVGLRVLKPGGLHLYQHFKKAGLKVRQSMFEQRLHTTVIYSTKHHPELKAKTAQYRARFKGYEIFDARKGERVLVMLLDAPGIEARHEFLMKKHGATYDFPVYQPHITLNYDFTGDIKDIPPYPYDIMLGEEYVEDLDLNAH
jgi:hypothetical protein